MAALATVKTICCRPFCGSFELDWLMYRLQKAGHKQARPLDEKAAPAARPHGSLLDDLVDEDEVFERTVLKEHLEPG